MRLQHLEDELSVATCAVATVEEAPSPRLLHLRSTSLSRAPLTLVHRLNSAEKYGVTCMHGDAECRGNIQQLCAHEAWQGSDDEKKPWSDWWVVRCLAFPSSG